MRKVHAGLTDVTHAGADMAGDGALVMARLSLNQATTQGWGVREAIEGCVRADIPSIGLWRDKVAETGLAESARLVRESGLRISSLCRGGMFPAATTAELRTRIEDNLRAIDEAA